MAGQVDAGVRLGLADGGLQFTGLLQVAGDEVGARRAVRRRQVQADRRVVPSPADVP
jgi:hypothetical protein